MPKGGKPGAVTVQTSFRFAPHVLVFPLVILLTLPVLRELLVAWNYWRYGTSYRRVTYVMDEFRPNSGSPCITGHFEGETDQSNLVGLESAGRQLVKALPSLSFRLARQSHVVLVNGAHDGVLRRRGQPDSSRGAAHVARRRDVCHLPRR